MLYDSVSACRPEPAARRIAWLLCASRLAGRRRPRRFARSARATAEAPWSRRPRLRHPSPRGPFHWHSLRTEADVASAIEVLRAQHLAHIRSELRPSRPSALGSRGSHCMEADAPRDRIVPRDPFATCSASPQSREGKIEAPLRKFFRGDLEAEVPALDAVPTIEADPFGRRHGPLCCRKLSLLE